MARDHAGKPSGVNDSESRTGIPSQPGKSNDSTTEKYTEDDRDIAENVRVRHPNRNTDKENASNAGGYKGGTGS
jgi:hypothetical protein